MQLSGTITNSSGILNVAVSENHGSSIATCTFSVLDTTLTLGDYVEIEVGYDDSNSIVFRGYVKQIERKLPEKYYTITANDLLVRAQDYFIASADPLNPMTRQNISAESLVYEILGLCGLTSFEYTATSFVFGVTSEFEVNLVGALDYIRTICDLLTWSIWVDSDGVIQFRNRKPYVMTGTSGQPGDIADTSAGILGDQDILALNYGKSENAIRNRVVVYGTEGIYAEATEETSALPAGFYKTAVLAFPEMVDSQSLAQTIANYNVDLFCRVPETISVQTWGWETISARQVITLTNMEYRFGLDIDGLWYIYGCDHQSSESGFITTLELRRMIKE